LLTLTFHTFLFSFILLSIYLYPQLLSSFSLLWRLFHYPTHAVSFLFFHSLPIFLSPHTSS
jgi:hypothetical protein